MIFYEFYDKWPPWSQATPSKSMWGGLVQMVQLFVKTVFRLFGDQKMFKSTPPAVEVEFAVL
jgi:hypothetical protein